MLDWTEIIKVLIPAIVTMISSALLKRQANKHNTRSNIMQLIIEDHVRVMEGKLPENRQLIHEEFDEYKRSGGNSYIDGKIDEYEKWYKSLIS